MYATRKEQLGYLALAVVLLLSSACAEDILITAASPRTEVFLQNAAAQVDVLWVVDNSDSMADEQAHLALAFSAFIANLRASQVDYHVGVISTDAERDRGRLHAGPSGEHIITPRTADIETVFTENVSVGILGSASEKAFESTARAFGMGPGWTPDMPVPLRTPNPGFLRRGFCLGATDVQDGTCEGTRTPCRSDDACDPAALFVIMVSDEDDKSFGSVGYYERIFDSYLGAGNEGRVSVSAIISPPGEPPCVGTDPAAPSEGFGSGDRYAELADATGGIWESICNDFAESLRDLSITAAGLKAIFRLNHYPDMKGRVENCGNQAATGLCVRVNDVVVYDWTYQADINAVIFNAQNLPPAQAVITVDYMERG